MMITLLWLSLLPLCSFAAIDACNQELLEEVDFPGSDIMGLQSPDVEHCQLLCTQHPSCLFFTFLGSIWKSEHRAFRCYLKSTPSGKPTSQTSLVGVTSGFSLKSFSCKPNPEPCLSQVYQNVDFHGEDYRFLFTNDYGECQRVCTQDPACQFFTFLDGDFITQEIRYRCHLKYSWNIPRVPVIERKAGVTSGFSQNLLLNQHFKEACQNTFFANTDIPGNDLERVKAVSVEHCQVMCSAHPQCTYFSFHGDEFDCYLKNNQNSLVAEAKEGFTSGLPARACQLDNGWLSKPYGEIDFQGSDIDFEVMDDAQQCQTTCTASPHCQFYTYVHNNFDHPTYRRRCYLKRVITLPAPPKVVKLTEAISGFSTRNCRTTV
ncbi:Coagulation factor XI [Oryzias melastigma]|uniref:Coagulation factor XI n=1 Tax=Oryzias melastigma TaxID=30732 RepID=A0A3B3DHX8_ORYME|nr:coagulation factor XI [Oryzias melastigma]KAF6723057.1 Coagulation factor XI [Oryzias melastigma]